MSDGQESSTFELRWRRRRAAWVVRTVAAELPPDATVIAIERAVAARCRADGIDPPSRKALVAKLAYERRLFGSRRRPRLQISVDFCAVAVDPRAWGDPNNLVTIGLAMIEPTRHILAQRVLDGAPEAADVAALVLDVASDRAAFETASVELPLALTADLQPVVRALTVAGVPLTERRGAAAAIGASARRVLGRTLGGMELRPRGVATDVGTSSMVPDAVRVRIEQAVQRHNGTRPHIVPAFRLGDDPDLSEWMREIMEGAGDHLTEP